MKFIFLLALAFNLSAAFAECGKDKASGVEYGWCIYKGEGPDVLYYFHGGGGSENQWDKAGYFEDFAPVWKAMGYKTPTVIAFSFGTSWLLSDMPEQKTPGLLDLAVQKILPALEKRIGGVKGQRLAMGPSMGGFNSAELSMRYPEKFARVAFLCPGLGYNIDPFASDEEVEKYIAKEPKSTNADNIRGIIGWVRRHFLTRENWDRHSPEALAKRLTGNGLSFYISCSKEDEYGFFGGAETIAKILAPKTYVKWMPLDKGSHCQETDESMRATAEFLAGKRQ